MKINTGQVWIVKKGIHLFNVQHCIRIDILGRAKFKGSPIRFYWVKKYYENNKRSPFITHLAYNVDLNENYEIDSAETFHSMVEYTKKGNELKEEK